MGRRHILRLGAAALASSTFSLTAPAQDSQAVRIGYQKSSTLLTIIKANGTLEKRLAGNGAKISWHEFSSGLPLLGALNVGGIDLSADVADTVELANGRRSHKVRAVRLEALGEQQRIADTFFGNGLLPKKVDTSDVAIWKA